MLKKLYKKYYKSRKTISDEQAKKLRQDIDALKQENELRKKQIEKFTKLSVLEEENSERYKKRIDVHHEFIKSNLFRIEEIEMILLDN